MFSNFLSCREFSVIREKGDVSTERGTLVSSCSVMSALVKFWGQRWAPHHELCHLALKLQHWIWYQARCSRQYPAWQQTVRHHNGVWVNKCIICCLSFSMLLRNSDQLFISLKKKKKHLNVLPYLRNQLIYFPSLCILHLGWGAKASSLKAKVEEILKQLLVHQMDNKEKIRVANENNVYVWNWRTWKHTERP